MADVTIDLERLRSLAEGEKCFGQSYCAECLRTISAAADKIEAQEREIDRLRELLNATSARNRTLARKARRQVAEA